MAAALTALGAGVDTRGETGRVTPARYGPGARRLRPGRHRDALRAAGRRAGRRRGRLRRRPPHAPAPGRRGPRRPARASASTSTATGACRSPSTAPARSAAARSSSTPPPPRQFVSALLLAGARYDEGVDVRHDGKPVPSLPHIDMTVPMLREHGVEVDDADAEPLGGRARPDPRRRPRHRARPVQRRAVPGAGRRHRRRGHRPRLAARDHARPATRCATSSPGWAARSSCTDDGLTVTRHRPAPGRRPRPARRRRAHPGGRGAVRAGRRRRPTCAASPTSAATRPTGWPRSPRELSGLGADVTEHADGLALRPAPLHGGVFHTYADHRMAHAAVIVGAAVDGVLVENIATTAKTFPDFADFWAGLLPTGRLMTRSLRRARPGALRPAAPAHPAADQGPPDVRRRRRRRRGHGRPRPLHAAVDGRHGDGDEGPAARPQGRRRRRPGPRRRRRLRRRRHAWPGSSRSTSAPPCSAVRPTTTTRSSG